MSRIRIDDLPEVENLTTEQMADLLGAGRTRHARLGLESLEGREVPAGVAATLSPTGLLQVDGTGKANLIEINRSGNQLIVKGDNHTIASFATASVSRIAVYARGGNDVIAIGDVHAENIQLDGGSGSDVIWGGPDREWIYGGEGNDVLHGGAGKDYLRGGAGYDTLDGGSGYDRYVDACVDDHFLDISQVLSAAVADSYQALANLKAPNGKSVQQVLGMPHSDAKDVPGVPDARMNDFQHGAIYWSAGTGAHAVYGPIKSKFDSMGGAAVLGLPITDQHALPNGTWISYFQHGAMVWSAKGGAVWMAGKRP